jgi:LPS-assembly protein
VRLADAQGWTLPWGSIKHARGISAGESRQGKNMGPSWTDPTKDTAQAGRVRRSERTVQLAMALVAASFVFDAAQAQESPPAESAASGAETVLLEANSLIQEEGSQIITAHGDVEARYQGRILRANTVIYDPAARKVRASGDVQIIDPDGSVRYADEVEVDDKLGDGVATQFSSSLAPNATVAAASAVRQEGVRNVLNRVIYTACKLCADKPDGSGPTWSLRARRAVQDAQSQMITYNDAVLEIGGVPVLYLPYFSHPDPSSQRRSGFLPPFGGRNSKFGAFYEQPYIWAISPYQDLTVTPRISERVRPILLGEYRRRFYSGEVGAEFSLGKDLLFNSDGDKFGDDTARSHIFAAGEFDIAKDWRWGFGAERTSDVNYIRRYDIPNANEDRGLYRTRPERLASQLYLNGVSDTYSVQVAALSFQSTTEGEAPQSLPNVLPYITAQWSPDLRVLGGRVSLTASSAALERSVGSDSRRASGGATWEANRIVGPGLMLKPFAEARADFFDIANPALGKDARFSRTVALAGAEARMPFVRPGGVVDTVIEPIAMAAVGVSDVYDPRIPNEDAQRFELDDSSVFRPNGAPNFDLYESGARAAAGVRATARWKSGVQASALVARRWRDAPDPQFSRETNLAGKTSDIVAQVSFDAPTRLNLTSRMRLDPQDFTVNRIDASASGRLWRLRANTRYFKINRRIFENPGLLTGVSTEEVSGGLELRLFKGWSLAYEVQRDLEARLDLRQTTSLIYQDDCMFVQLGYDRSETRNSVIGPTNSVRIRIGLATLGDIGREDGVNRQMR